MPPRPPCGLELILPLFKYRKAFSGRNQDPPPGAPGQVACGRCPSVAAGAIGAGVTVEKQVEAAGLGKGHQRREDAERLCAHEDIIHEFWDA